MMQTSIHLTIVKLLPGTSLRRSAFQRRAVKATLGLRQPHQLLPLFFPQHVYAQKPCGGPTPAINKHPLTFL
jgi:hypothetical protein